VLTGGLDAAAVLTWTQHSAHQEPLHIIAHDSAISCVAFAPGDDRIITCSDDGCVMLWLVDRVKTLPRVKKFEVQNQMFEDEYLEFRASLEEHKSVCRPCAADVSWTKDVLGWQHPGPAQRGKVPHFAVSASGHDSVAAPLGAAGAAGSRVHSCGIQRLKFFGNKSGLACAAGRRGVGLVQVGHSPADELH
jgi:WD40 repeat protein